MFAGAAREVVFSNPEVVQRIKSNFVPVALKAGLVHKPTRGVEGQLYQELRRTQAAPQGICVMNSAGKVLDWVLSFEEDDAIPKYFDDVESRYKSFPLEEKKVSTRRFRSFPNHQLGDVADSETRLTIPLKHHSVPCPAASGRPKGSLIGKVVGRPLDDNGEPVKRTLRQEEYMEATFEVSVLSLKELVAACEVNPGQLVDVPESFVRDIVGPAYLGQLDVSPLIYTPNRQQLDHWWKFQAKAEKNENGQLIRITGQSHIAAAGQQWDHAVTLSWQGYLQLVGGQAKELEMMANGQERLRWQHKNPAIRREPDAAHLMAGHPIDLDCQVVYGLSATLP